MGQPGLGAGLPTWEPSGGGGGSWGEAVPSRGDPRDLANWKGLELREQEGGGDYLWSPLPGAGLPGGVLPGTGMGGYRSLGHGARGHRPTELDTQR